MSIQQWEPLKCECGGALFRTLVRLKYKADGGTVSEPAGHECTACNAIVDNAYLIRLVDMNRKRKQVKELLADLGEEPVEKK